MVTAIRRGALILGVAALLGACDAGAATPTPGPLPAATQTPAAAATNTAPVAAATNTPGAATATPAPAAVLTPGPGDGQVKLDGLYHMSRDPFYRSPGGAVPAGTVVHLRLRAGAGDLTAANVRVWDSRAGTQTLLPMTLEKRDGDADYWGVDLATPKTPNVFWYRFQVQDDGAGAAYEDDKDRDGGKGEAVGGPNDNDYSINSYDPQWTVPAWLQDAVIYQIFPDRFNNGDAADDTPAGRPFYDGTTIKSAWGDKPQGGNDFFGGDLQGVIDKLDYLQSLGVTVIYLNPIFDSASNHGYDTRDYTKIAPRFGTQETFDRLIAETKKRNMHVILDGVFNHTGSDSLYFDRYSRYPTSGAFEAQDSPYFGWYRFPKWPKWYLTFGNYDTLPALQEVDPVRDFIFRGPDAIAKRWLQAGAAGWRLDAPQYKSETWWRDFRTNVRSAFPDAVLIGEFWTNATQYLTGDEWDGTMSYRFLDATVGFVKPEYRVPAEELDNQLASLREDYPPNAILASMNTIDSHDKERALTVVGGDKNRLRLLALLQFTSAGPPTVYYGDEAGLEGGADPDDRRTYPWGSEDQALLAYYRALGAARHEDSALRTGSTTTLLVHNDNRLYAYARHDPAGTAVVALNAGSAEQTLDLDLKALVPDGTVLKDRLSGGTAYTVQGGHIQVKLGAVTGALLTP
jgi:glycosidase